MKICTKCQVEKPIEEFSKRSASKDGLNSWCKPCKREKDNSYYLESEDRQNTVKAARDEARQVRREIVWEYLRSHPCVDCGEADPIVLEFDHVNGTKIMAIATMVQSLTPVAKILAEIEKCEVRCANCHRRVTASRGNWRVPDWL